jgi:hypothetical protein
VKMPEWFLELSRRMQRVQKLIDDPKPGLVTWHEAMARAINQLDDHLAQVRDPAALEVA